MYTTHRRNDPEKLPRGAADALAVAEIPASKLGPSRRARLSEPQRELYFWILRRFAAVGRPSRAETRVAAGRLGVDVEDALAVLAREDLVPLGRDGEITVAYPFSGRPTAHHVHFRSGHEIDAMCAIDALGITPMFGEPIQIASRDPLTREQVRVQLMPDGAAAWQPESAVVIAGAIDRCGESFRGCCPALNFFASPDNAERWLAEHGEVRGDVISMPDAIAAGRAVFGDVLDEH
jgi:alkylmercury lyase